MNANAAAPPFDPALIALLRRARRVVVLTGAGISAESGVPTFRDAQTGLWTRFQAEELATVAAFHRTPKLVWDWYAMRRENLAQAQPNPGHVALVELERHTPEFWLITQNVDGLHQRAGSRRVIELHGNIHRTKCFRETTLVEQWADTPETPPRCPNCGGPLRPDVVWFGERLPADALGRAFAASRNCEVFFSIGTSAQVQPAASLPYEARRHGAKVIEINSTATPLSRAADWVLEGPSGMVLPALLNRLRGLGHRP